MVNYSKLYDIYPNVADAIRTNFNFTFEPQDDVEAYRSQLFKVVPPADLILTIGEHLNINRMTEVLYTRTELLHEVRIGGKKVRPDNQNRCLVREYYKELAICYIFVCSEKEPVSFSRADREKSPLSRPLFSINFNQKLLNLIPSFYVTLTEPNVLPQGSVLKWVTFNTEMRSMRFLVHFYVFHSILLPAPYESNCVDYGELGFTCKQDMRDRCLQNESFARLGLPFHTSLVETDVATPFAFVGFIRNQKNSVYHEILAEIVDKCDQQTKSPDCNVKYYMTERRAPEHIFRSESELVVDQIRQPNIRVELHPKMRLADCGILVASVLSAWFGFAIYQDFLSAFAWVLRKFHHFRANHFTRLMGKRKMCRKVATIGTTKSSGGKSHNWNGFSTSCARCCTGSSTNYGYYWHPRRKRM